MVSMSRDPANVCGCSMLNLMHTRFFLKQKSKYDASGWVSAAWLQEVRKTAQLAMSPLDADRLVVEWLSKGNQFVGCYGYRDHMKLWDEMFPQTVRVHTEKKKAPRRRGA